MIDKEDISHGKSTPFVGCLGLAGSLWAADPFIGTWKLNVAKSKAPDPSLLPKSEVFKNVAQGNLIKTMFDGVESQGKSFHSEGVGEWNGKSSMPIMKQAKQYM